MRSSSSSAKAWFAHAPADERREAFLPEATGAGSCDSERRPATFFSDLGATSANCSFAHSAPDDDRRELRPGFRPLAAALKSRAGVLDASTSAAHASAAAASSSFERPLAGVREAGGAAVAGGRPEGGR